MGDGRPSRRTALRTAGLAATALAAPFVRSVRGADAAAASGSMVLAWHTNIAPRWLDPQQHDGGATPDDFLNVVHDALIKNFRGRLYDHPALAQHFEFAEDAKSATFRLRPGPSSTTAHQSRPKTSNGAMSTITAPGPKCCRTRPTASRSPATRGACLVHGGVGRSVCSAHA
jgi:hypothetical protein